MKKINIAGLLSEAEDEDSETDSNALTAGTDKISTSDQNIEYENGEEPLKLGDILDIQRSASPTTTIAPETEESTFMEYQPIGTNQATTVTPMLETEETTFTTLTTGTLPDWDDWDFREQSSTLPPILDTSGSVSFDIKNLQQKIKRIKVLLDIVFRSAKPTATMSSMPEPEETTFWDYPACNPCTLSATVLPTTLLSLLEISDYSGGEDELEEQDENEIGFEGSSYPEESESELEENDFNDYTPSTQGQSNGVQSSFISMLALK